jgi:hypothetical protein
MRNNEALLQKIFPRASNKPNQIKKIIYRLLKKNRSGMLENIVNQERMIQVRSVALKCSIKTFNILDQISLRAK